MNIRHIAQKAGVSVATVSRVLNHPESVAPSTKRKIEEIIAQEEYTPNWFARGLNFNKTATIGLMIPHILNPVHMEIAKGVEDVAHNKDYTTFMCNAENDIEKERKYIDNLVKRRVDGIVLISSLLEENDIEWLLEQEIPIVLIGENRTPRKLPIVRVDCQSAAYKATMHLIENGYTRIDVLRGLTPEMENRRKVLGYQEAMKEAGLKVGDGNILFAENTIEGGYLGGKKLLESNKNFPFAIFATSDLLAFGVMDAMKDNNVLIPEQVAVVGFDNIRMSNQVEPKLTTVEKPLHKMGVLGARLLFDIIESKNTTEEEPKEILLQSKLKIRKSSGHKERIGEMF